MSQEPEERNEFPSRIFEAAWWFGLTEETLAKLFKTRAALHLQLLMDVVAALHKRNPADHNALIEEWCKQENAGLGCTPQQAVRNGRLRDVLDEANRAELVEPPVQDWSAAFPRPARRRRRPSKPVIIRPDDDLLD